MFKQLIKSISREEWKFIIGVVIFVILLTTLPYIYGWLATPAGYVYTGLHSLTPGDIHVYFSYMEQVRQGDFVGQDLYTSEPQARVMLNGFWSVMGLLAKVTGLSNNIVFHLVRILFIPLFLILLYLLSVYFWERLKWRKVCMLFLCFASGLGVLASLFFENSIYSQHWYNWPLDLWAAENNSLLIMFQSPHLIVSTILIILVLWLFFLALECRSLKYSVIAGILGLLLFQFHPFHVVTIFGVSGFYLLARWIKNKKIVLTDVRYFLVVVMISLPSILYYLLLMQYDFVTQIRTYQNVCLTPSLVVTLSSYGFVLALALVGVYNIFKFKKIDNKYLFLMVWMVVQFGLLYSPLPYQRRLMQGLNIPMAILAAMGLYYIYQYLRNRLSRSKFEFWVNNRYLLIILFVILFSSSSIYNWIREIFVFTETYPQLYISEEKEEGFEWLKNNTSQGTVILSDLYDGNLIPGRAGRKVFAGHGVETLFYNAKFGQMAWFFAINNHDDKKEKFLRDNNISYVFFSENEDDLGEFNPEEKDYLNKVFESSGVEIYKVKQN